MNALLAALLLALGFAVTSVAPQDGPGAVLTCFVLAAIACGVLYRGSVDREFLLRIFIGGLLVRMVIGTVIYVLELQGFFGGDANGYDSQGYATLQSWQGELFYNVTTSWFGSEVWGMQFLVATIYAFVGRNMLAVQFFNAVLGAATAPAVFLCAHHLFQNIRVARLTAFFIAFYPSLVLWSSQGLKDGPVVFLLAVVMLVTLKLNDELNVKYVVALAMSLIGILSLRFYIFYMMVVTIGGAFVIGARRITPENFLRQFVIIIAAGLVMTYLGVVRKAGQQFETYGSLETVQHSRFDLAVSAQSGFGQDVDVSTASGAISAVPIGVVYLLFAPFPWQVENLRQSITLPEMVVWWASFPLLVLGLLFTIRYRWRQALPILVFTVMLTLAYAVFQGNVGTAYRQRSQLLIFYFIFVAVGFTLVREKTEDIRRRGLAEKQAAIARRSSPHRPSHRSSS